ncbi:SET domain-containing protein [Abortiporus biennis]|nr:SET domain-containing protein [Abortiporus biennis]
MSSYHSQYVVLGDHPAARSQALAHVPIQAGCALFSEEALVTTLFSTQKGLRCDYCHASSTQTRLLKCSGCASFWYCNGECQTKQWNAHHRRICKALNRFTASPDFQTLSESEAVDALLLSQFISQLFPKDDFGELVESGLLSTFLDLLPARHFDIPPLCRLKSAKPVPQELLTSIYSRFGNNNFVVHSHLNVYAHGIFPHASRFFNHSCDPNAVARYIINQSQPIKLEIVALRPIAKGEEITIPYLDPALSFETRDVALRSNYGFKCRCSLCEFSRKIQPAPPVPTGPLLSAIEEELREHVFALAGDTIILDIKSHPHDMSSLPQGLYCLFDPSYLPAISETFSKCSHEGQYEKAISTGVTLLALYFVIYPSNYPQIGMHALELAKTAWNRIVATDSSDEELLNGTKSYLRIAGQVLRNFGKEGDEGGPLEELDTLTVLLEKGG